ncbi:MAG: nucleotidyl transferase AbiEii/AbiGii toxin family protein [Caldilinea sp.]|nr:nucleotidyl transferase AbiEii/AbiGii toxin family protein [Caldilinea sp.]MCB0060278.1 nucleotidyl transferase AbiEii/AbiGii toxin family protein [Caldilineaceae bacterium]MCB0040577.1 nucleotidyl transferase AbiEii/AbiGii toxin family protein [Caldilinea sp.]MCB0152768.1 nucleotidyl transferase AbiEii/AbiGii toxin family protein [Caldilineaceae bacterium]MCB9115621.1 nucleotidyl transferase AbiEii/AbiGii toxin family protein [Caldilineaceae bacterium]
MASFAPSFYFETLYPLQDAVLQLVNALDTGFYLSGGTASSRGYLQHRFSDDLDLFVNDDNGFALWASRVIEALAHRSEWTVAVTLRESRFVRLTVTQAGTALKIEMINDVPAHTGEVWLHPQLGRLDSAENILANKVTALVDRTDPKDFADIWGFCSKMQLPLGSAISNADSKAAGIFPIEVARVLDSASHDDWAAIKWISPPDPADFVRDLQALAESLILNP